TPEPVAARIEPVPTPGAPAPSTRLVVSIGPPPPTAAASDLSLESTEFRFIDPPEPGAHARVAISVANHASTRSGRILLGIPATRPGPVRSVDIPRLKLKGGGIQTAWEAPPFAVGQIKGTANISQGNTVLIGHLSGAAGNVFAHLDERKPGDEITAVSRGLPY